MAIITQRRISNRLLIESIEFNRLKHSSTTGTVGTTSTRIVLQVQYYRYSITFYLYQVTGMITQYSLQYRITGTSTTVQFTGTVSSVQRYLIIALIIIGTSTGTVGSVQSYR